MTQVTRTRIAQDWQARFPMLGHWKAGRLLRRVGPLVQGVCLDRSSNPEDYLPIAHIHFLGMVFPTVALQLPLYHSAPNGSPRRIEYRFHDQEYVDAADQLRRDYLVPSIASRRLLRSSAPTAIYTARHGSRGTWKKWSCSRQWSICQRRWMNA